METNFNKLEQTQHMLKWFSEQPFQDIVDSVENMFIQQSATTRLIRFEIMSEPEWLTGGKQSEASNKIIVVRCGLAVSCDFTLQDDSGRYDLNGIFTWVATHLDQKPITQMWMDLNGTMQTLGKDGLLAKRIYELDL